MKNILHFCRDFLENEMGNRMENKSEWSLVLLEGLKSLVIGWISSIMKKTDEPLFQIIGLQNLSCEICNFLWNILFFRYFSGCFELLNIGGVIIQLKAALRVLEKYKGKIPSAWPFYFSFEIHICLRFCYYKDGWICQGWFPPNPHSFFNFYQFAHL